MSFFFDVYGPFEIERNEGDVFRSKQSMWDQVDNSDEELRSTIGCYMFCIRNGSNIVPWYVGMTVRKEGFYGEVFEDHKLDLYNFVTDRRGVREMFFFPLMTGDMTDVGRFSRSRSAKKPVILWLEKVLMGIALERNPELLNTRDLTLPRSVTVRGLIGERLKGRPYHEVAKARQALFGNSEKT